MKILNIFNLECLEILSLSVNHYICDNPQSLLMGSAPQVNYHPSNWVRPTPVAANGQPLPQEEKRSNSPLAHVPAFVPRNMPAR